jgi:hypothetical protein
MATKALRLRWYGRRIVMDSPAGSEVLSRQPDQATDWQIFNRHNCQFYSRRQHLPSDP